MNTTTLTNTDIEICRVRAPLQAEAAWEVESFLLKLFEYGDYSFRSALLGQYSPSLNCTFFLAKHKGTTVAAAGCLYPYNNPTVSILGPVGVAEEYRRQGIATRLVLFAMDFIRQQGGRAIYLGVSKHNGATELYKKLGFERYQGVVMRRLFCRQDEFERDYFGPSNYMKIRRAVWGDWPGLQVLSSFAGRIYTFDFGQSIFSSRYFEPARFAGVIPAMFRDFARNGGFANVLVSKTSQNVVGIAHIRKLPSRAQQHVAVFDFYVHDNFIEQAELLARTTIIHSVSLFSERVNCYCPACDKIKRDILLALDGRQVAVLPGNIRIDGKFEDVLVYQLKG